MSLKPDEIIFLSIVCTFGFLFTSLSFDNKSWSSFLYSWLNIVFAPVYINIFFTKNYLFKNYFKL